MAQQRAQPIRAATTTTSPPAMPPRINCLPPTAEQLGQIHEAFSTIDRDGNGSISLDELRAVLAELKEYPSEEQLKAWIDQFDGNHNGTIEFGEFISMVTHHVKNWCTADHLAVAFAKFDLDGNGYITCEELEEVMSKLGHKLTTEQISEMIAEADDDGDGQIDFGEFKKVATNIVGESFDWEAVKDVRQRPPLRRQKSF